MASRTDQIPNEKTSPKSFKWYESLHFRFVGVQIALLAFIVSVTVVVIVTVERRLLVAQGLELSEQLGDRVVSELNDRLSMAESLVTAMANLGESLDTDVDRYMQVIPNVLNYEGEEAFIAGGGIWPEPNAFTSDKERRSFFWGRDERGKLIYYDDYNDPTGPGYHNEEWYVPARFYPEGKVFWSKSYMDPYSYQPMVTVTAPMRRDGKFIGVATVDIKLEGLAKFLEESAEVVGGYIFAVDRNNKLLSFPREDLAKIYTKDRRGQIAEEFIDVYELAKNFPAYRLVAAELNNFNQQINQRATEQAAYNAELVDTIASSSYQIGSQEAQLIASILTDPLEGQLLESKTHEIVRIPVENDPILNTPVMVSLFHVPGTYWKVAVATPMSRFYAVANAVTWKVAGYMVLLEVIALLIMFHILKWLLLNPIKRMSREIQTMSESEEPTKLRLDDSRRDELGVLAGAFNSRTERMYHALDEIDKMNSELEQRVMLRTEELTTSERKFRRLIEGLKDDYIIYSLETGGIVTYISPSSKVIFGKTPREIIGKNWRDVINVTPESLSIALEQEKRLRQERCLVEYDLVYFDAMGNKRYLEVKNRPVLDDQKEVVAIEGIGHDITESKAAESQLQQAQDQLLQSEKMASIGQLAAGIAHEINNPVGYIGSNIQTLETYIQSISQLIESCDRVKSAIVEEDMPELKKLVVELEEMEQRIKVPMILHDIKEIIHESQIGIGRIKKIVNDLRTFSREDPEQDEIISINTVIDSVLGIVHNELKYRIELRKDYQDIPHIKCNPQRLGQVFVNLILNAVQAIEDAGIIEICTYQEGDRVVAEISDNGPGIAEENLSKIFNAFYTTKPVGQGTGLGLSISYEIIKKHGGDIQVESTLGKGTTFRVILQIR